MRFPPALDFRSRYAPSFRGANPDHSTLNADSIRGCKVASPYSDQSNKCSENSLPENVCDLRRRKIPADFARVPGRVRTISVCSA